MVKNKKTHKYLRRFNPHKDVTEAIKSAKVLANVIAKAKVSLRHQKKLLSVILWLVTEANGKYSTRYRTKGVLKNPSVKIQHEHVFTRKSLIAEMLNKPRQIQKILDKAIACMVTVEEHRKLSKISEKIKGWHRYRAAKIIVYDMKAKKPKVKR